MLTYFTAWLSVVGVIIVLFPYVGSGLKSKTKRRITEYILESRTKDTSNWSEPFAELFDQAFTKNHLSLKCITRSVSASVVAIIVVALLLYTFHPSDAFSFQIEFFAVGVVIYNFIPDYISLFETRYVISKMKRSESMFAIMGYLSIDVVLTFMIFSLMVSIIFGPMHQETDIYFTTLGQNLEENVDADELKERETGLEYRFDNQNLSFPLDTLILLPDSLGTQKKFRVSIPDSTVRVVVVPKKERSYVQQVIHMFTHYWEALSFKYTSTYMPAFLYSTFFTSIWIWLYTVSLLSLKLATRVKLANDFLIRHWDVDKEPMRFIGLIAVIITTLFFLAGVPFIV